MLFSMVKNTVLIMSIIRHLTSFFNDPVVFVLPTQTKPESACVEMQPDSDQLSLFVIEIVRYF